MIFGTASRLFTIELESAGFTTSAAVADAAEFMTSVGVNFATSTTPVAALTVGGRVAVGTASRLSTLESKSAGFITSAVGSLN